MESPVSARPVPRCNNAIWMQRHRDMAEQAASATDCRLLFAGDSITDHWRTKAVDTWHEHYAPLAAVNLGISGDRTQHLLWRLQNGALGAMQPAVVVLLIGTNNLGFDGDDKPPPDAPADIAAGIQANVACLRERLPAARILLLGLFPRGEKDSPLRAGVAAVNRTIARLHDERQVFFLDLSDAFLAPDGTIPRDLMPDLLHPNALGYAAWAAAMQPTLDHLTNPPAIPPGKVTY